MVESLSSFQLGNDLDAKPLDAKPGKSPSGVAGDARGKTRRGRAARIPAKRDRNDHFVTRDGMTFAGAHLIVDLWGASGLNDLEHVEEALRQAVSASGATLLHVHLHHFTPNGGISGVAVLAESHISIHTWPERSYAALDIFMCGAADPQKAVPVLDRFFKPARIEVEELRRGRVK
jgi:S-adenosylmethionine decarboxylase